MKLKLKDIAEIQIGYQHREKGNPAGDSSFGRCRIIQTKDVDPETFSLPQKSLYDVNPQANPDHYKVKKGDVLFLSRGPQVFAVPVLFDLENTIASYCFYIVKIDSRKILPEYLAWFINQPQTQAFLDLQMQGSHMKMVSKSAFCEIEVEIPSIPLQRKIVELEKLRCKEEELGMELIASRRQLVGQACMKAIKEAL